MLIKPCEKYIDPLKELWHNVFGDDYEYISLFFNKEFFIADTFIKLEEGKIVSALYLLNGAISFDGKKHNGKYLYAAATDSEYRGRGYMAELINEAKEHCIKSDVDFISLVPANEHLYSYYEKFGFVTAMHRYKTKICCNSSDSLSDTHYKTEEINFMRASFSGNFFTLNNEDLQYAVDCITSVGGSIHRLSRNGYFILSDDFSVVEEFISSSNDFSDDINKMLSCLNGEVTVYSPYNLELYGETEKLKYGMIYPINENLKINWSINDIYMNLALD